MTAHFRELLLDSRDTWFGATDLCLGPDGSVYLSDFYDKRTAHPDPDADWDRSNGRIYKIEAAGTKPLAKFDLAKLPSQELVELSEAPERLVRRPGAGAARRAARQVRVAGARATWPGSRRTPGSRLQGLWALHATGGFDDDLAAELLKHPGEARPRLDGAAARRREDGVAVARDAVRGTGRVRPAARSCGRSCSARRSGSPASRPFR